MTNVEIHASSRGKMLSLSKLSFKRFFGKKSALFSSCLVFVVITQALLQSAEAQIKYTVTRLVPISGVESNPTALNAQGDVVGTYRWRDGTSHVFLNHAGIMHDIAALAGSAPRGINIYGRIVGDSLANVGGYTYFENKVWPLSHTIPGLAPVAVNTASHILCVSDLGVLIWQKCSITLLPPYSFLPIAFNNSDQIVGFGYGGSFGNYHAFLISGSQPIDLGTLGNMPSHDQSFAYAVNDQGQVVGASSTPVAIHAFLYSGGKIRDIHTFADNGIYPTSSDASGINNSGQVVGQFTDTQGNRLAFVYDGSQMINLETLIDQTAGYVRLYNALAINDAGQILAEATFQNGASEEAILLTPVR
jgi:probable HAF family extracellular repeat protein